ncbi:MAG: hypothetical protein JHC45_01915 [Candidatus Fonsibacter sp.]|nr:hypothetical protein [Candidatus Fonsibacter sp.]
MTSLTPNNNEITLSNGGSSEAFGMSIMFKQIIANNDSEADLELVHLLFTQIPSPSNPNKPYSISEVFSLMNHDKRLLTSTGAESGTFDINGTINFTGTKRHIGVLDLVKCIPTSYGRYIIEDLYALQIEGLKTYSEIMTLVVPILTVDDAKVVKNSFFAGASANVANATSDLTAATSAKTAADAAKTAADATKTAADAGSDAAAKTAAATAVTNAATAVTAAATAKAAAETALATAKATSVLNRSIATGQKLLSLTNSGVTVSGSGSGVATSFEGSNTMDSNSIAKIWSLFDIVYILSTTATVANEELKRMAVTKFTYDGGNDSVFTTKSLTIFNAFNLLIESSLSNFTVPAAKVYETAKILFEVLILSEIKGFVQDYYKSNGEIRGYSQIISLMSNSDYTQSFGAKFNSAKLRIQALSNAGYSLTNVTSSTWFIGYTAGTRAAAQSIIKDINSVYPDLLKKLLEERLSWFGYYKAAQGFGSQPRTVDLDVALTMVLTTDASDDVYIALQKNIINGNAGFINVPSVNTVGLSNNVALAQVSYSSSGFPTALKSSISTSNLLKFKIALYFTTALTFPLISTTTTTSPLFTRKVSRIVITDLAVAYFNNLNGWQGAEEPKNSPNDAVIFALTNQTINGITTLTGTTALTATEKRALTTQITGPDHPIYVASLLVTSNTTDAYTNNMEQAIGDINSTSLNTTISQIWNTKVNTVNNVLEKTLYGGKPKLSLLAYIFGLSSVSDKATLLKSVLTLVSSDDEIKDFFDILIVAAAFSAKATAVTANADAVAVKTAADAAKVLADAGTDAAAKTAAATAVTNAATAVTAAATALTAATTAAANANANVANASAAIVLAAIGLFKSCMLSGADFNQETVAGLFNSAFSNTENARGLLTPVPQSTYDSFTLANIVTAFRSTWFTGVQNYGFTDLTGGINFGLDNGFVTLPVASDQAPLAPEISFTTTVTTDVNILRCRIFYSKLNYNSLYAAVVVDATRVTGPGLWLKFISATSSFSKTKYPLSLLLSLTYNAQSFDYTTGVLSESVTKQLISGKDANERLGYDKELIELTIRQFASLN